VAALWNPGSEPFREVLPQSGSEPVLAATHAIPVYP
jgi:hypothetical protein